MPSDFSSEVRVGYLGYFVSIHKYNSLFDPTSEQKVRQDTKVFVFCLNSRRQGVTTSHLSLTAANPYSVYRDRIPLPIFLQIVSDILHADVSATNTEVRKE